MVPDSDIESVLELYPQDLRQGSPFDTGIFNALTPQFKRLASFQGDAVFQAPRRLFFGALSGKVNIWSYGAASFNCCCRVPVKLTHA